MALFGKPNRVGDDNTPWISQDCARRSTKKKKYAVTIRATITKTLNVLADNEEEAESITHEDFSAINDGTDEHYTEEVLSTEEKA